jgi:hypothetical protein
MPKKRIPRRGERRITVRHIYRDYYDDRSGPGRGNLLSCASAASGWREPASPSGGTYVCRQAGNGL